jgi:hypothetical protein
MSIFKDVKSLWNVVSLVKQFKEEKMDFKNVAGWIKVIGYVFAALGLVAGYVDTQKVVAFTIFLSAFIKIAEIIAPLTKTTVDDQLVGVVKKEAEEHIPGMPK